VREGERRADRRSPEFFRLTLSYNNLANYYKTNHVMMRRYSYALAELESMLPWERDVYIGFIMQDLEKQANKAQHP
jgi:hypothetical protein